METTTTAGAIAPDAPIPASSPSSEHALPDAISLDSATKSFGHVRAVAGIDLSIRPGEVVAFLGPNGAGKTTSLDMILGLSQPTSGTVEVFGMAPRAAIARGLVAAVLQSGGLLPDLTVAEMVSYTALLFAQSRPVAEVLERAGISKIASRKVGKCSGGEQQRLRFAMALLSEPALLILDEPTTGMDVEGRRRFWHAIRADADRGRTVLFATHYLEEADAYADRIILLAGGRVVADGTTAEVKALAAGRVVRADIPGGLTADQMRELGAISGVEAVESHGQSVHIQTANSDAVARYLLNKTGARELEIAARALEDAFVELTAPAEPAVPAALAVSAAPATPSTVTGDHHEGEGK